MARARKNIDYSSVPETLDGHPFFGLELDEEQKHFRDAIWSDDKLVVVCDAKAGTGKTQIAVATAELLYQYGRYDGIVYVTSPVQESKIGFLPGTPEEKLSVYNEPFRQAAIRCNINPDLAIESDANMAAQKNGAAYIKCESHTFLRGTNYEKKVIIIDEAQNAYKDELKKILTRIHDNCKVILIGHSGQCDLYHHPENSGFYQYVDHFAKVDWAEICHLTHNHRGKISSYADEL